MGGGSSRDQVSVQRFGDLSMMPVIQLDANRRNNVVDDGKCEFELNVDDGIVVKYNGDVHNGNAQGHGIVKVTTKDGQSGEYEGEFDKGFIQGKGIMVRRGTNTSVTMEGSFSGGSFCDGAAEFKSRSIVSRVKYHKGHPVTKHGVIEFVPLKAKYEGPINDKLLMHGHGKLTLGDRGEESYLFVNGGSSTAGIVQMDCFRVFQGDVSDDHVCHHGKMYDERGSVYAGEFTDGFLEGQGVLVTADGKRCSGTFVRGKMQGFCKMKLANGMVYTGDVVDNVAHGKGTMRAPYDTENVQESNLLLKRAVTSEDHDAALVDSSFESFIEQQDDEEQEEEEMDDSHCLIYIGDFTHGYMIGKGQFRFPNGMEYAGDVTYGQANGKGTLKWFSEEKVLLKEFEGDFVEGQCVKGVLKVLSTGAVYDGEVMNGVPNGHGSCLRADGSRYLGLFKDGDFHGQGFLTFFEGHHLVSFAGEFQNNALKHGRLIFSNGNIYEGDFERGEPNGRGKLIVEIQSPLKMYEGEFLDGELHGEGVATYVDGRVFRGCFRNGEPAIRGKMTWPDGRYYEGELDSEGSFTGYGVLDTPANPESGFVGIHYTGQFLNGGFQGKGKLQFKDGREYEGDFVDGQLHGKGFYTWPSGRTYEGEFAEDCVTGEGVMKWHDSPAREKVIQVYEGRFYKGNLNGKGKMTWPETGKEYVGDFKDDEIDGMGKLTLPSGRIYECQFVKGAAHGGGVLTFPADPENGSVGRVYRGQFVDGDMCGRGVMTFDDGRRYIGGFKDNGFEGTGEYHFPNGDVYTGEFENDSASGLGKMVRANGTRYEGRFVRGKYHGQGKFTFPDGSTWEGQFANGEPEGEGLLLDTGVESTGPFPAEKMPQ
eukprot:TRINITY_DN3381_c0_g2_i1.p1 TRINITY_DN3381_c0_g2~~TRINITY_DN3381_c0_g2_i1.p1  ORF type:complete len:872 (+),score=223.03 TRINITY_DN3381_c0_g2_i1:27-2642(+)